MLIQSSVFHSPNCPGNLKETNLFTHSRKCAVIKHRHCGLTSVPTGGRGPGGSLRREWVGTITGTETGGGSKTFLHFKEVNSYS